MTLAMDLTKVVFAAEPGLLNNDIAAGARAAAAAADLLGCIMATVFIKEPNNYQAAMEAIIVRVHEAAIGTAKRAAELVADSPPERPQ